MAQDLERLVVQLSADIRKYENSLNRAMGATNSRAKSIESRFAKMNKTIAAQSAALGSGLIRGIAALGGAKAFQEISDSATKIRNSLSVAGLSGEHLETTFDKLYESAQRNSVPITSLAELYSRVSLNQKELGVSSSQLVGLTDNVGKALRISGADAESAGGALLQLAQALGSNKIQAEEYNSLIDTMPALLQAAANGIVQAGGSVSKLTQLVKSGKISNKAFFDGIEAGQQVLDQRLAGSVQTVGQRFTVLRNAVIKAADRFNENTDAADALGKEFGNLAGYIDALDFTQLVADLQSLLGILETGTGKAQAFALELSKITGLRHLGAAVVDALPGESVDGKKTYFGGLLTVQAALNEASLLKENAERRLSIEQQIAALKKVDQSPEVARNLEKLQAQLASIPADAEPTSTNGQMGGSRIRGGQRQKPEKPKVDTTNDRYKPLADDDEKTKKARKERLDDYAREVKQLQDRTAALAAETAAQAQVNPLIEDYGFAVEKARAKQELLTAAQEAGKQVTPELAAQIEVLATSYATASVTSERLAEKQDEIRERAEEALSTAKDVTRGIIDGFTEGAKAGDILVSSLKKIGDALLNDVLDSIFKINGAGGGGGGMLSGLLGLFGGGGGGFKANTTFGSFIGAVPGFAKGTNFAPGGMALVGEKGPELVNLPRGAQVIPKIPKNIGGGGVSMTFAPVLNAPGADKGEVAALRQDLARMKAEFNGRAVKAVQDAQRRNMKV